MEAVRGKHARPCRRQVMDTIRMEFQRDILDKDGN
jgi:hypothetical protein